MSMDHPNVNHFLGEFATSKQLESITKDSAEAVTMMVSSYCGGGDHFSVLMSPEYKTHSDPFTIHVQCQPGDAHKFCFVNPEQPREVVNHGVIDVRDLYDTNDTRYLCICSDDNPAKGTICRVAKIDDDEQFFSLWSTAPACPYPYDKTIFPGPGQLQFTVPFALLPGQIVKCFLLGAKVQPRVALPKFYGFFQCMPRPNVAFIRAFAFQMLRGLGHCHRVKLIAHNGESCSLCLVPPKSFICNTFLTISLAPDLRTVNIFHKNPLMACHFLFAAPPHDCQATLRAMKVELGDFGCATALQPNHNDFRFAAMAL